MFLSALLPGTSQGPFEQVTGKMLQKRSHRKACFCKLQLNFPVNSRLSFTKLPTSKQFSESGFYPPKVRVHMGLEINPTTGTLQRRVSFHVSRKPPTYPSPDPTFVYLLSLRANVGLGKG